MTDESSSVWGQVWRATPQISALVGAVTVVLAVLTWALGGIRPQSQVEFDNLKAQVVRLDARMSVVETRLDSLPRASDFQEWTGHLSRLDAVFEGQRDKVTASSYDIKDLQNKYLSLTTTPGRK